MVKVCGICFTVNNEKDAACSACGQPLAVGKLPSPAQTIAGFKTLALRFAEQVDSAFASGAVKPRSQNAGGHAPRPCSAASPAGGVSMPPPPGENLYRIIDVGAADQLFIKELGLEQYPWFTKSRLFLPAYFCRTAEDFARAFCEGIPVSDTNRAAIQRAMSQEMREDADAGGVFGVFIHGRGCFINGWLCAKACGQKEGGDILSDNAVSGMALLVAVHERLGHGFLAEFTSAGEEAQTVNKWKYAVASRFNLKFSDTPDYALWEEKWKILFSTSRFFEEGWASWIEDSLAAKLGFKIAPAPGAAAVLALLSDLAASGRLTGEGLELLGMIDKCVKALFCGKASKNEVIEAIIFLQCHYDALNSIFSARNSFGRPAQYVLGRLLIETLADKFGVQALPLLLKIAGNVMYQIGTISGHDLSSAVGGDFKLNLDARLAVLTCARAGKGDLLAIAESAREDLDLAVPGGVLPGGN